MHLLDPPPDSPLARQGLQLARSNGTRRRRHLVLAEKPRDDRQGTQQEPRTLGERDR